MKREICYYFKNIYWCFYPHTLKDSVSPVCRIFFLLTKQIKHDCCQSLELIQQQTQKFPSGRLITPEFTPCYMQQTCLLLTYTADPKACCTAPLGGTSLGAALALGETRPGGGKVRRPTAGHGATGRQH